MKIKKVIELQRIIGKIDNDFNLSESDWIPRTAAWCIDALSQMDCLPTECKKRKLEVNDREAYYPCPINGKTLKVYDENGCEIEYASSCNCTSGCSCTQNDSTSNGNSDQFISVIDVNNKSGVNFMIPHKIINPNNNRNFVIQGQCIELNFDARYIITEMMEIATYYDEYYDCDVPYIYDDGLLLEALAWYVLYKYLSRGSKHPVFSLTSQNPATNPFAQWNTLRIRAAASVKNKMFNDKGWRNFFYNSTFDPRNS